MHRRQLRAGSNINFGAPCPGEPRRFDGKFSPSCVSDPAAKVVAPDERAAASGVTSIARSVGAAVSPALAGVFFAYPPLLGAPFLVAGGLKIVYDLLLYRSFRKADVK